MHNHHFIFYRDRFEVPNMFINNLRKSFYTQHNIQNVKRSAPPKDYEILRRRIFLNTKEVWYYIDSQLQLLRSNSTNLANRIDKIKDMVGEHFRSLLKDVSDLALVDNYSNWRKQESEELDNLLQHRLHDLQNPPDCNKARKLVCELNKVFYTKKFKKVFIDYLPNIL